MRTNPSTPINRLILIGNGLDLAHKMKTSYGDFILWYFNDCLTKAKQKFESGIYQSNAMSGRAMVFENDLMTIQFERNSYPTLKSLNLTNIADLKAIVKLTSENRFKNDLNINFKSSFFRSLIQNYCHKNWVDIENHYYESLTKIISSPEKNTSTGQSSFPKLEILNKNFDIIKKALESYLTTLHNPNLINDLLDLIYERPIDSSHLVNGSHDLGNTLFLNFNYTSTPEFYKNENTDIIYIHGKLNDKNNPIIFGYGDEHDESYTILEKANNPEVFTHIKSFDYFKTNNYSRFLSFLESPFDVYIMGHSCGLSDRTLLSTIFEHDNCRLIKIFYYNNMDRYRETTYEISRHFKDKAEMRSKVINFSDCSPMPQLPS